MVAWVHVLRQSITVEGADGEGGLEAPTEGTGVSFKGTPTMTTPVSEPLKTVPQAFNKRACEEQHKR